MGKVTVWRSMACPVENREMVRGAGFEPATPTV